MLHIVLAFLSLLTFAKEPDVCQNLAELSCAPGTFKDGTGETISETTRFRRMNDLIKTMRSGIDADFTKVVNDPKEAAFVKQAIESFGLKSDPECKSTARTDVVTCRQKIIEGLASLAQKEVAGPDLGEPVRRLGNFKQLEALQFSESYRRVTNKYQEMADNSFSYPGLAKRVREKIFPDMQKLLVERIQKMNLPESDKQALVKRIKEVQLDNIRCEPNRNAEPDENLDPEVESKPRMSRLLEPELMFNPKRGKGTVRVCEGIFLQTTSEFALAGVLAHEISHSIGPCIMNERAGTYQTLVEKHPLKNVISCLTGNRSVGLRIMGESKDAEAPKGADENHVCQAEYVDEVLSDWLASEVLPLYIEKNFKLKADQYQIGYSNFLRTACSSGSEEGSEERDPDDTYPPLADRINKLLLPNPKVRKQMGCTSKLKAADYCDSDAKPAPPGEVVNPSPAPARSAASLASGVRVDVLVGPRHSHFSLEKTLAGGTLKFTNNSGQNFSRTMDASNYEYLKERLTRNRSTNSREFCPRQYIRVTSGNKKTLGCIGSGNAVANDLDRAVSFMAVLI